MATTRARLVWAALLAFALRALIPLGFMPAGDGSLSLMICPGGLPAGLLLGQSMGRMTGQGMAPGMGKPTPLSGGTQMPRQQPRGHGSTEDGYCTFTTGFSSAPPPMLLAALLLLVSLVTVGAVAVLAPTGIRLVHLPQARAPPAPL